VPDIFEGPSASERLGATHPMTVSHSRGRESLKSSLTICRNYFENIMFAYGFIWLRIGIIGRLYSVCVKGEKFFDHLTCCWLL